MNLARQWIATAGGSCDVRMGYDALEQAEKVFVAAVGRPRSCMVVMRSTVDDHLRKELARQLADAGFEDVHWYAFQEEHVRTIEEALSLTRSLARAGMTADDLCVVVGDQDVISVASYVCGTWCAGMSLVAMPMSERAFLEGALIPRALDVEGMREMVLVRPCARHVLMDWSRALTHMDSEDALHVRALMVSAAMASSEKAVSELWDQADAIMAGDEEAFTKQLMATAKARGQAAGSTAAVVRQSIAYGQDVAWALRRAGADRVPFSTLMAEGLRFVARLAVAQGKLSLDDMLAQDELLDMLGLGVAQVCLEPSTLVRSLKDERFQRTNRFMLLLPLAMGRVRLATVEDALLEEHAKAWCAAHATTRNEE